MPTYRFLGDLTGYSQENNAILLHCSDDRVRVRFVSPQTVRITVGWQNQFYSGPDYALAHANLPAIEPQVVENVEAVSLKTDAIEVRIRRRPCRFAFYDGDGHLLNRDEPAFGLAQSGDEVACFKSLQPGERFYGLGEKIGALNRRGGKFVMCNTDTPEYTPRTDPLYQSQPFYLGELDGRAYGIFFNNTYRSIFNLGAGNHRLAYFSAEHGPLDYFFFAGPTLAEVIREYTALVGRMPLPPLWALGYQQCRWSYYPESTVRTLAQQFRDRRIPCDAIYLDIHYMHGYRCFTFDPERFPDPAKMLASLRQQGFRVVTIVDPGIKVNPGYAVYDSGVAGDHFIKFPDGERYTGDVWPGPSHFANFTRPETRHWWGDLHRDFLDKGVAGFWNDMNEPAVWGKDVPPLVQFDENGEKVGIKKIRNVFGHLMAQATYEGMRRHRPDQRPFILTRAGFSGTARYAASWTGDNTASFEHLELAIRLCLSMGLSGIPFTGADIGGFHDDPDAELFVRWMQVGAFTPLFRTHTVANSRSQEPWSFGEAAEAIVKTYIELRYRLLPYTYTAFREAASTGLPIMRPLFLEFPGDPQAHAAANSTTYLWGKHLLVAPVTRANQRTRQVYLPEGEWYDFWENRCYDGGQTICVKAPLQRLPLFVRAGAVLPMREVQQFTGEKPLKTLELHIFPGTEGESRLYEDDGESFEYERGQWRETAFHLSQPKPGEIVLRIASATGGYQPQERDLLLVLHGQSQAPARIEVDGKRLPARVVDFSAERGEVRFSMPDDGQEHVLRVTG